MAKISTPADLTSITDTTEFMKYCSQLIGNMVDIINGRLSFGDNVQSQEIEVSFTTANTDIAITHKLNKTGVKYWPVVKSKACDVFTGSRAQTNNTIYLQCTQVATVTLELF